MPPAFFQALELASFRVRLEPRSPFVWRGYLGAAFRGGFGYAFKAIVCPTHDVQCIHERLGRPCVYSEVFETPVPPGSAVMRKYPRAPHPFVLTPPLPGSRATNPGARPELELVLVGRAIPWLAYFICTLEELGRRGVGANRTPFGVGSVTTAPYSDGAITTPATKVYDGRDRTVTGLPARISGVDFLHSSDPARSVTLRFLTPARIVAGGELADALPFVTLFRTLLRRLALLAYFHCGQQADVESMRTLIRDAETVETKAQTLRWYDWERFSTRQRTHMKLGGLLGEVTYEGELAPFLPFLRAGTLTHVGKGTSFGLGKYAMEEH